MLNKLRTLRYLRNEIIFLIDVFLSSFSSIIVYVIVSSLSCYSNNGGFLIEILGASALFSMSYIYLLSIHKAVIRHFAINDYTRIISFALLKSVSILLLFSFVVDFEFILYCVIADFILTSFIMILVRCMMITVYYFLLEYTSKGLIDAFIYSTQGKNPELVSQINKDTNSKLRVRGFLTTNKAKEGVYISGQKVYYVNQDSNKLLKIFRKKYIRSVIFVSNEHINKERNGLVEFCIKNKIAMYQMGGLTELDEDGGINNSRQLKPIVIEDLLSRDEIAIDIDKIQCEITGKVVMVTGAAGSIGSEIATQVASFGAKQLILFDVAETPLHNIQLELTDKYPNANILYVLGDIRSFRRVDSTLNLYKPSVVFHAAAYKHVPMIESNPCEGVMTNVWGTVNMAQRCVYHGVEKFVMISTDKAVNPTNVMGATKRVAEMCVQSKNLENRTKFVTTRFGNVLGSNGSVIPLFRKQIEAGGPVTVTHKDIIRYFMTIPEACRLVLQAATMGHAGEILVFDMGEQVRIADLAERMIRLSGLEPGKDIKIEFSGLRPGEKLYEELLTCDENTTKTQHQKIRVAQSSPIESDVFAAKVKELIITARSGDKMATVKLIKEIVVEFKSKNSIYETLDS